nr:hypothetical protein [Vibrio ishigakensis]
MDNRIRHEIRLIGVAIICALLLILGHVILFKSFVEYDVVEPLSAAIPFVLMGICVFAIRAAMKK